VRSLDLESISRDLEPRSPEERLAFAVEQFGDGLLFTSSFGAGSGVLLHMWSRVARHRPVVFIDTGFLFPETLAYRDSLVDRLGLSLQVVRPDTPRREFLGEHGDDVMARDPDFCCAQNKIAPLAPLLPNARAWVSGLRRDQSDARRETPILLPTLDGPIKVHPLATMTSSEALEYMAAHGIPDHPLRSRRYLSIGCEPCTRAVEPGEDERAGRWAGTSKTECGLHTHLRRQL
jgi:phosphoadenosine phosphosulfate reductase